MGSLQDQLLKSGLVSEQKLKEARSDKRKRRRKSKGGGKGASGPSESDLAKAYAERARVEQRERDRELNRKREEERRRRERNAQLKQLIEPNAKNDPKGEVPRHFEHKGKIRKLYLNEKQQAELNDGKLGIVFLRGRYFVVVDEVVRKVAELSEDAVAFHAPLAEDKAPSEDDAYADERFQVPDDLQW